MLKNYFRTAYRNLWKRKFNSFVMISGLTCSLTLALVVGSFVRSELKVNQEIENLDAHFLMKSNWAKEGMGIEMCSIAPLAKTLKEQYPSLVKDYYTCDGINSTVRKESKLFREVFQPGNESILGMYNFPLLHGDKKSALTEPFTVVITQEIATKYFGKTDVLNESLSIESFSGEWRDFKITGVLSEIPKNSIFNMINVETPILMSEESLSFFGRLESARNWQNAYLVSFLELTPNTSPKDLEKPIAQVLTQNTPVQINENLKVSLAPLSSLYLNDNNETVKKYIQSLALVVLFILIMAMVNFVNISVNNASYRIQEVGVRKTMGSLRTETTLQLLFETILLAFLSAVLAVIFYTIGRSYFSTLLGYELVSILNIGLVSLGIFLLFTLFIGILAGLYPAIVISAMNPILALKGKFGSVNENRNIQRVLITSQFGVSLFVVICGYLISRQISHVLSKDLGFDKSEIMYVNAPRDWSAEGVSKMNAIAEQFKTLPEVENVSLSFEIPDGLAGLRGGFYLSSQDSTQAHYASILQTDGSFFETYGIPLSGGKAYSNQLGGNEMKVMLNDKASELLGYKDSHELIGKNIVLPSFGTEARVVGICKNFNFENVKEEIKPLIFSNVSDTKMYRYLSFRLNKGDLKQSITALNKKWSSLIPNAPFEYQFLDEKLNKIYTEEIRLKKASNLAILLSAFIVIIGVIGMVSISIIRRKKEISIRRVLGASALSINWLVLREYSFFALLAIALAIPLALINVNKWLEQYAYRIDIEAFPIIMLGITFLVSIAGLISLLCLKAIRMKPVENLKE